MEQITVGLDFGTHQTKICVERKNKAELEYSFFKFPDLSGRLQYTFPSIIKINPDETLSYGFIEKSSDSQIIRYFKQSTFTTATDILSKSNAKLYTIWYIAYLLFLLEEKYDDAFAIQMGVPSDSYRMESQKQLAVSILVSAFNLVENVYRGDRQAFLSATVSELKQKTEIFKYSKAEKDAYQILVFPEAYACLMPLVSASKIPEFMSLMIDIGGGTTDVSFFSIEENKKNPKDNKLRVYRFKSINKGLNFLTDSTILNDDNRSDSTIKSVQHLKSSAIRMFKNEISDFCLNLRRDLRNEFRKQGSLADEVLEKALTKRPIVYTGGGSSFDVLRCGYFGFEDIIHISQKYWRSHEIRDMALISSKGLCPILSTAYGLAISRPNDKIICEPFRDIFSGIRQTKHKDKTKTAKNPKKIFGQDIGGAHGFSYMDDYDAWK